jgi:hypothetical protein
MKNYLLAVLNNKKTFWFFLVLGALSSLATFLYANHVGFSDEGHYWSLAEGMHHGKFSAWYFLPMDTPETLRTWGYPFFLYLCQFFTSNQLFPKIVQLVIYAGSIYCILRLIKHFYAPLAYRTFFLMCLVFNNHLSFYSGVLIAECLTLFFVTLFVTLYILQKESYVKYILLAIICFALYQLRPIFMLFPLFLFIYVLLFNRKLIKYHFLLLTVFCFSLVPFALWNKANHGVYKVTPLEGGAGVALQGGYWEYRLPIGFNSEYYWGIHIDNDLLQPTFLSEEKKTEEAKLYLKDWAEMEGKLHSKFTKIDSLRELYEADTAYSYRRNFRIYSSAYTLEREEMLKEKFLNYVKQNPVFYFKTRVYVFFRQWVTGINATQLAEAKSLPGYIKALYPFLVTFIFILLGLFIIIFNLLLKKLSWKKYHILFLFMGYIAFADIPFGVMSRYTVPVHLFILLLLSVILVNSLYRQKTNKAR